MKKTLRISIIITVIIMLVGCSSAKKADYNMLNPNANDTTSEDNSLSSKQSQSQSKDTNSNSLENIDTTKSPFEKGYYDYKGTINNNIPIQMSIYPLGKDIVGTYFYEKQRKEIKLKGKSRRKEYCTI